jgi:hypothetical protein
MPVSVPPAPSRAGFPQASGCTKVSNVAELFAEKGSVTVEEAVAVFVNVPEVPGAVTEMAMIAVAAGFKVPRLQVTTPAACVQLPCVAVAETYVTCVGKVSLTEVAVADATPRFCTERV